MRVVVAAGALAVWLGSPALNWAYVPWGASGASWAFGSAAAIWLLSTLDMIIAFQRSNERKIKRL